MDIFPIKFNAHPNASFLLWTFYSGLTIVASLAFWFLFAAVIAAGVKYGINYR